MYSPWAKKQERKADCEGTKGKQEMQFRAQQKRAPPPETQDVCMYVRVYTVNNKYSLKRQLLSPEALVTSGGTRLSANRWILPSHVPLFASTFHLGRHTTDLHKRLLNVTKLLRNLLAELNISCICRTKHLLHIKYKSSYQPGLSETDGLEKIRRVTRHADPINHLAPDFCFNISTPCM
jgi:hypothetical protein